MAEEETQQESESAQVLLKEIPVKLESGETIYARPWGMRQLRRMGGHFSTVWALLKLSQGGEMDLGQLWDTAFDEVTDVLANSYKIPRADIEGEDEDGNDLYTAADGVAMLDAVMRINFTERPSLAKNVLSLFGATEGAMAQAGVPTEAEPTTTEPTP